MLRHFCNAGAYVVYSLSKIQKIQHLRAIHRQTDPQMKAILTPAQYEKLKTIRQQAIQGGIQKHRGQ